MPNDGENIYIISTSFMNDKTRTCDDVKNFMRHLGDSKWKCKAKNVIKINTKGTDKIPSVSIIIVGRKKCWQEVKTVTLNFHQIAVEVFMAKKWVKIGNFNKSFFIGKIVI